jgi:hypothetical protein
MKTLLRNAIISIKTTLIGLAIIGVVVYGWYERGDYDLFGLAALLLGSLFLFSKDTVLTGGKAIFDAILKSIGGGGGGGSDRDDCDRDGGGGVTFRFDRNKKR